MNSRIAITGLGFITPIGNDRAEVLNSLHDQKHGLAPVSWFPDCVVKLAGTIKGFDLSSLQRPDWTWPDRYELSRETLRSLPPHGVYAVCAAEQALAEAELDRDQLTDGETGLFCASAGSPRFLHHHLGEAEESDGRRVHPWGVVTSIAGTLNFNLATYFGIKGAVTGFVSACAASTHAIGYACDEIALGRQQRMIVIGAEEPTWESLLPFNGMRALSLQQDPQLASCPFDVERNGFVGAGGGVALVLENIETAQNRGASIQAEITGWGQSADGHSVAQSDPEGSGLGRAIERALKSANIAPTDLDYINAHATSTKVGDIAEIRALQRLLGEHRPPISSTKGLTGHPLSMSGALETAISTLAIGEGFIPGNAHLREPDPVCGNLHLPRENLFAQPTTILKNSSGFGGSNVSLVLRKPVEQ